MKSPEFWQGSLKTESTEPTSEDRDKRKINTPDEASKFLENDHRSETNQEKTDKRIEEVLSWLKREQSGKPEFAKAVEGLKAARVEKEKGTFEMLRELWGVIPSDCKTALIGEFIFNPNALKARYYEEMHFQRNLKGRWKNTRN